MKQCGNRSQHYYQTNTKQYVQVCYTSSPCCSSCRIDFKALAWRLAIASITERLIKQKERRLSKVKRFALLPIAQRWPPAHTAKNLLHKLSAFIPCKPGQAEGRPQELESRPARPYHRGEPCRIMTRRLMTPIYNNKPNTVFAGCGRSPFRIRKNLCLAEPSHTQASQQKIAYRHLPTTTHSQLPVSGFPVTHLRAAIFPFRAACFNRVTHRSHNELSISMLHLVRCSDRLRIYLFFAHENQCVRYFTRILSEAPKLPFVSFRPPYLTSFLLYRIHRPRPPAQPRNVAPALDHPSNHKKSNHTSTPSTVSHTTSSTPLGDPAIKKAVSSRRKQWASCQIEPICIYVPLLTQVPNTRRARTPNRPKRLDGAHSAPRQKNREQLPISAIITRSRIERRRLRNKRAKVDILMRRQGNR